MEFDEVGDIAIVEHGEVEAGAVVHEKHAVHGDQVVTNNIIFGVDWRKPVLNTQLGGPGVPCLPALNASESLSH